jgi:nucleoside-diphosphate-sugar epimerase
MDESTETKTGLSLYLTGATTYLGRAVTRQCVASGHTVTGQTVGAGGAILAREDGGLPVYDNPYRAGEIVSSLRMAQADVLLNLVPQVFNQVPQRKIDWDVRLLTEGTATALDAAEQAGVKFFIHVSYAFLYGDTGGEWVNETAASHAPGDLEAFDAALEAEKLVLNSNVPSCVLRAGYVYGPQSEAFAALHKSLGRPVVTGSDEAYSNWITVDDLVQALILAAEQQKAGEVFNIVDDTPATPQAFVNGFAESLGLAHPRVALPFLARPSKEQVALLDNSVRVKNDKAKTQLGWSPKYPDFRQGIEQALLYWRAAQPVT